MRNGLLKFRPCWAQILLVVTIATLFVRVSTYGARQYAPQASSVGAAQSAVSRPLTHDHLSLGVSPGLNQQHARQDVQQHSKDESSLLKNSIAPLRLTIIRAATVAVHDAVPAARLKSAPQRSLLRPPSV